MGSACERWGGGARPSRELAGLAVVPAGAPTRLSSAPPPRGSPMLIPCDATPATKPCALHLPLHATARFAGFGPRPQASGPYLQLAGQLADSHPCVGAARSFHHVRFACPFTLAGGTPHPCTLPCPGPWPVRARARPHRPHQGGWACLAQPTAPDARCAASHGQHRCHLPALQSMGPLPLTGPSGAPYPQSVFPPQGIPFNDLFHPSRSPDSWLVAGMAISHSSASQTGTGHLFGARSAVCTPRPRAGLHSDAHPGGTARELSSSRAASPRCKWAVRCCAALCEGGCGRGGDRASSAARFHDSRNDHRCASAPWRHMATRLCAPPNTPPGAPGRVVGCSLLLITRSTVRPPTRDCRRSPSHV